MAPIKPKLLAFLMPYNLGLLMSKFVLQLILATVFWFGWSALGVGVVYFDFLPLQYQQATLVKCIGLFLVLHVVLSVLAGALRSVLGR